MESTAREHDLMLTRRQLFGRARLGIGTAAMAQLFANDLFADDSSVTRVVESTQGGPHQPATAELNGGLHHRARAKRVIYLFMSGGPSHHDLWDYKPKMQEMAGQDLPESVRDGQRITGMTSKQATLPVAPSKYKFSKANNNRANFQHLFAYFLLLFIGISKLLSEIVTLTYQGSAQAYPHQTNQHH